MLSELPLGTQSTSEISLPYEDSMAANDERQGLMETLWLFRTPDPVEVRTALPRLNDTMLQHSIPSAAMKEDLRRFVVPSMKSNIQEIILLLLPPTNRVPIYSVALRVHWELEEYLDKYFDAKDDNGNIMTLTGEVACAQALPCGEYMQQTWPRTGAATFTAVQYTLLHGSSCE